MISGNMNTNNTNTANIEAIRQMLEHNNTHARKALYARKWYDERIYENNDTSYINK